ncbi:hypothetical protein Tco_1366359 [Tanacetum coccineum]
MTKVIKGESEKLEDLRVEDVSLTCDTSLEVFNNEFNRLSRMDGNLFTYEVEVANIPCGSNMDDDSEHEADDDIGYDPFDIYWIRGNDKVELTDEESSDNEDDVVEVFRINTNIFDYETPLCLAFNEFNYLLKNGQHVVGERMVIVMEEICPVLTNKAIMEGLIEKEDDDESCYEGRKRWNVYTNYDDAYKINHDVEEREELCEIHELSVCNIRRFEMIKYSFEQDEVHVAIKEDEYDDLARTSKDACRAYQKIFRMMNEGWMVTRAE